VQRTHRELRKFGLTVGGVFLLLGVLSWWRGHSVPPLVLGSLGTLLVVPGLLAPRILAPVERRWMAFASLLGEVNARLILTVVFFALVTPIGFVLRLRHDPLDRRLDDDRTSDWRPRGAGPVDPMAYRKQY